MCGLFHREWPWFRKDKQGEIVKQSKEIYASGIACIFFSLTGCVKDSVMEGSGDNLPADKVVTSASIVNSQTADLNCGFKGFDAGHVKTTLAKSAGIGNLTPPFGRPNWGPHAANLSKREFTWCIRKNYTGATYTYYLGTSYTNDASNSFVQSQLQKVLATWSSVVNIRFRYTTEDYADIVFEWHDGVHDHDYAGVFVPSYDAYTGDVRGGSIRFSEYNQPWNEINGDLGRIYAVGLHEVGHFLGLGHAWEDTWDYRYGEAGTSSRACVSGGRCKYPVITAPTINAAVMDYRWGRDLGRHVTSRVLTDYDIDYARAKYGAPDFEPWMEIKFPSTNESFYTNSWEEASGVLTAFSNSSTLTSSVTVNTFLGAIHSIAGNPNPPTGGWWQLHRYMINSNGRHLYMTSSTYLSTPGGHTDEGVAGYTYPSVSGKYSTKMYQHYSSALNNYIYTNSSTPPAGYVYNVNAGYYIKQTDVGTY